MIKNFIITGDTHGRVPARLDRIKAERPDLIPEETAIVILGDAGINYWLNKSDQKNKRIISGYGYTIYCVRGNHEERPEFLGYAPVYDDDVKNFVRVEEEFPLIRYLFDGGAYQFKDHYCLVIGGAYSVDKWHRLAQAKHTGYSGWFEYEQLSEAERTFILDLHSSREFDFILSHTCPKMFEPTDIFLPFIDQSTVDKSMEEWLDNVADQIDWKVWCFGHFHADRIEAPCVEQFYYDFEEIDHIWNRWYNKPEYDKEELERPISPLMERLLNK